jgi:hypothetical protein
MPGSTCKPLFNATSIKLSAVNDVSIFAVGTW